MDPDGFENPVNPVGGSGIPQSLYDPVHFFRVGAPDDSQDFPVRSKSRGYGENVKRKPLHFSGFIFCADGPLIQFGVPQAGESHRHFEFLFVI